MGANGDVSVVEEEELGFVVPREFAARLTEFQQVAQVNSMLALASVVSERFALVVSGEPDPGRVFTRSVYAARLAELSDRRLAPQDVIVVLANAVGALELWLDASEADPSPESDEGFSAPPAGPAVPAGGGWWRRFRGRVAQWLVPGEQGDELLPLPEFSEFSELSEFSEFDVGDVGGVAVLDDDVMEGAAHEPQ